MAKTWNSTSPAIRKRLYRFLPKLAGVTTTRISTPVQNCITIGLEDFAPVCTCEVAYQMFTQQASIEDEPPTNVLDSYARRLYPILFRWPWPWPGDLHIRTWPIYSADTPENGVSRSRFSNIRAQTVVELQGLRAGLHYGACSLMQLRGKGAKDVIGRQES